MLSAGHWQDGWAKFQSWHLRVVIWNSCWITIRFLILLLNPPINKKKSCHQNNDEWLRTFFHSRASSIAGIMGWICSKPRPHRGRIPRLLHLSSLTHHYSFNKILTACIYYRRRWSKASGFMASHQWKYLNPPFLLVLLHPPRSNRRATLLRLFKAQIHLRKEALALPPSLIPQVCAKMSSPEASANSANKGLGWQQSITRWKTSDCRIISKPFLTQSHKNVPSKVNKLWKLCLAVYRLLFFSRLVSSVSVKFISFLPLWQNRCYALIAYKTQIHDPPVNTGREMPAEDRCLRLWETAPFLSYIFFFSFLPPVAVSSYVKKKIQSAPSPSQVKFFFFPHLWHLETCWLRDENPEVAPAAGAAQWRGRKAWVETHLNRNLFPHLSPVTWHVRWNVFQFISHIYRGMSPGLGLYRTLDVIRGTFCLSHLKAGQSDCFYCQWSQSVTAEGWLSVHGATPVTSPPCSEPRFVTKLLPKPLWSMFVACFWHHCCQGTL